MFDFVNDQSEEVGNFVPNTDLTYGEMKRVCLKAWAMAKEEISNSSVNVLFE